MSEPRYECRHMTPEEAERVKPAPIRGRVVCLRRPFGSDGVWYVTYLSPDEYREVFPEPASVQG